MRVGRLEFAGCSASRWNIRCGWGAVLGASRRRLGGVGLGYVFLDASHFRYHAGAAGKLGAGRLGVDTCGKPVSVGLDAAAVGSGDA
jgi:hypothetical protein